MEKPIIKIKDNGPYQVTGSFTMIDDQGNSYNKDGDISLCRCGHSHNKPFCDNTHEDIRFESKPRLNKLMVEV